MCDLNLLPCPFCGGGAYLAPTRLVAMICCNTCETSSKAYPSKDAAITAWNRRTSTSLVKAENKAFSHVLSLLNDVLENDNLHDFDQLYADVEDIAVQIKHLLSGESCYDEDGE